MVRMEIELTSSKPDGTWTWRAAGARLPKGSLEGSLLYDGAKVGDIAKAEADVALEGVTILTVAAPKGKRAEPERIALLSAASDGPPVTYEEPGKDRSRSGRPPSGRAPSGRPDRGTDGRPDRRPDGRPDRGSDGRPDRRPDGRPDRGSDRRPERGGPRSGEAQPGASPRDASRGRPPSAGRGADRAGADRPRPDRAGADRPRRESSSRRPPSAGRGPDGPSGPARPPRPRRLQPGRAHRDAALAALPAEHRAVAEQLVRGGIPALRQALAERNTKARAAGAPEVKADALVTLGESLLPALRAAEWRDRAEAIAADVDTVGLRDLRAVVAGSDAAARDPEARALATRLREALERRRTEAKDTWLAEVTRSLDEGRVLRALRVSAKPPEPGVRFPVELAGRLAAASSEAMTPDTTVDRWSALLEAVLASPVVRQVQPQGLPAEPGPALTEAITAAVPRMPGLAPMAPKAAVG